MLSIMQMLAGQNSHMPDNSGSNKMAFRQEQLSLDGEFIARIV